MLELAVRRNVDRSHVRRTLPLAFLAPDIVQAFVDGSAEAGFTLSALKRLTLPASWRAQLELLRLRRPAGAVPVPTE